MNNKKYYVKILRVFGLIIIWIFELILICYILLGNWFSNFIGLFWFVFNCFLGELINIIVVDDLLRVFKLVGKGEFRVEEFFERVVKCIFSWVSFFCSFWFFCWYFFVCVVSFWFFWVNFCIFSFNFLIFIYLLILIL